MGMYTDIAAEIYPPGKGTVPQGVKIYTASAAGIGLTRVDVERSGLRRPQGRYITLDMPQFAAIDDKNEAYVWAIASQLRTLLPKEGLVLVAGVGNPGVTADALGPATAAKVFVTRHICEAGQLPPGTRLRPVAAFAPGVEGTTGMATAELLRSMIQQMRPAAVLCVDSLYTSDARRLGCSVQLSTAGLVPQNAAPLTQQTLGVPVIAVGVPTVMEADSLQTGGRPMVMTPKDIDAIIRHGASLLSLAINKALQPAFSVGELTFLTS